MGHPVVGVGVEGACRQGSGPQDEPVGQLVDVGAETTELLEAAGCRVEVFDPLTSTELPAGTQALYLGGGFPEVHAAGLTGNTALREQLRQAVADGLPTVAECAGLLYLCRSVDDVPMIGALDAEAVMSPRLTLAYRTGIAGEDTLLTRTGERFTAHEFHRTHVEPVHGDVAAWIDRGSSIGFAGPVLHASYLHTHWAGAPRLAQRLADAAATSSVAAGAVRTTSTVVVTEHVPPVEHPGGPGLNWHGDAELQDDQMLGDLGMDSLASIDIANGLSELVGSTLPSYIISAFAGGCWKVPGTCARVRKANS